MRLRTITNVSLDGVTEGHRRIDVGLGANPALRRLLGAGMDPGNPVGQALNARPKYVASTTLTDPRWAGTTVLLTYPVVVGQGTRLFPANGPDTGLELVDLRSTSMG